MRYLEPSEIVAINSVVTSPYGESCLVTDREALEAAVAAHQAEDSPRAAAASLLSHLLAAPPFQAGSARTAVVASLWLLSEAGLELSVEDDEFATRVRTMKNEHWDTPRISSWFEGYLRAATSV